MWMQERLASCGSRGGQSSRGKRRWSVGARELRSGGVVLRLKGRRSMKIHPLLAASVSLLIGVIALGATAVVAHRRARARRPPPPAEVEDAPVAPRRLATVVARAAPPRRTPAPPAPAPR